MLQIAAGRGAASTAARARAGSRAVGDGQHFAAFPFAGARPVDGQG